MGRVLPSGRVFGEAVALPNIKFAQREKFGGRIGEVIESPVTSAAVAGISRIKDELDYQDRLHKEKSKVAAADVAENKAQAALQALQEQQVARTSALAAAEERAAQIAAAGEAKMLAQEQADIAGAVQGEALDAMRRTVQGITPGGPHAPFAGGMTPEQQFHAGLDQAEDPEAYYEAWQAEQAEQASQRAREPYIAATRTGSRAAEALVSPQSLGTPATPPIPEMVTPEQLAEAQATLSAAEEAASVPMAFVPRTMADYRFKVRELERALVSAETTEERQVLGQQLLKTIQTARGAVDVPSENLMEAITGAAGKRAQKVAYDEMTTAEKEFLKQMYDASKEKRAAAKEAHAVEMRPELLKKARADAKIAAVKALRLSGKRGRRKYSDAAKGLGKEVANFVNTMAVDGLGMFKDTTKSVGALKAEIRQLGMDGTLKRWEVEALLKSADGGKAAHDAALKAKGIDIREEALDLQEERLGIQEEKLGLAEAALEDKKRGRTTERPLAAKDLGELRRELVMLKHAIANYKGYVDRQDKQDMVPYDRDVLIGMKEVVQATIARHEKKSGQKMPVGFKETVTP